MSKVKIKGEMVHKQTGFKVPIIGSEEEKWNKCDCGEDKPVSHPMCNRCYWWIREGYY
jgi:hypothetical protein